MKMEFLSQTETHESKNYLLVDFHDQYHAIRREWGDHKINVPALCRFFDEFDPVRISAAKAPDYQKVKPFDRVLQELDFNRIYVFGASKWVGCVIPISHAMGSLFRGNFERLDVISSDPQLGLLVDHYGVEDQVKQWSFSPGFAKLPSSLLSPIPIVDEMDFHDDLVKSR